MKLVDIAYARSGDKGDVSNIGVIAKDAADFERIGRALTPQRIKAHFKEWVLGEVTVHPLANIHSYNVVCERSLGGGATSTVRFDQTGKAMSTALLRMDVSDV
jgi:hypothetical protein